MDDTDGTVMSLRFLRPCSGRSIAIAFLAGVFLVSCEGTTLAQFAGGRDPLAPAPIPETVPQVPQNRALAEARQQFENGAYGNAARYFEIATAHDATNGESWLGLAASYDRLRRFDLADDAYSKAEEHVGSSAAFFNNRGYSYLLRGDFNRAAQDLNRALQLAPDSETVRNNVILLRQAQTN